MNDDGDRLDLNRLPMVLRQIAPDLEGILTSGGRPEPKFSRSEIRRDTVRVSMRDGTRLATEFYVPPLRTAPVIAMRTPYSRTRHDEAFIALARHGYIVTSQDCRGTGDSEPDIWDTYIYELEDSYDFVEWISRQDWFSGFLGACGGSYVGSTQWAMAMHPRMSCIVPEVAGLMITPPITPRLFMYVNAYSHSVGKGADKIPVSAEDLERQMESETLAGGYYNDPIAVPLSSALLERYAVLRSLPTQEGRRWLWEHYRKLRPAERADLIKCGLGEEIITLSSLVALDKIFGQEIPLGLVVSPCASEAELVRSLRAPALVTTGWYDWDLGDTLASWQLLAREASPDVASRSRLLIAPSAHNHSGYHEGREEHPELNRTYRTDDIVPLLLRWYATIREDTIGQWPPVVYYLMGANQWYATTAWPLLEARVRPLYLGAGETLSPNPPPRNVPPARYMYDPVNPPPTVGGNILSNVYIPGSVDVSEVQQRSDVLSYTSPPLTDDLDVIGPLRLVLYASSSAVDTDFAARLADVFPDGRAIQLQLGVLRTRYRNGPSHPQLLEPGRVYRLEIDLWATANRFKTGHRIRLDISSADFPRFDRNANRGGSLGASLPAEQTIYHDPDRPSHLLLPTLGSMSFAGRSNE